jgi:hypothetical protein
MIVWNWPGRVATFLHMTRAAKQVIDSFEALAEQDKSEVLAQLLRQLIDSPYVLPTDEQLTHAADSVFQECDRREAPVPQDL